MLNLTKGCVLVLQVIYFHNPLHRPVPAPVALEDWARNSPCGPIAAFAQLHPFLQVGLRFARYHVLWR